MFYLLIPYSWFQRAALIHTGKNAHVDAALTAVTRTRSSATQKLESVHWDALMGSVGPIVTPICSPFCGGPDAACNSTTGECLFGDCYPGYTGPKCEISVPAVDNGYTYNRALLASILAVLFLCFGSIMVFL
ncbi:hypothetical protein ElyMa_000377900 [Elysia marginata]|uniref:EGF-like domain-containing protein n=1 Tax=Elysia marginata TaxID=1093978 RepID=A0AAV4FJ62_9GAST|nr:hypothetical protein ElyMa_000377900 [Elysia marginata]